VIGGARGHNLRRIAAGVGNNHNTLGSWLLRLAYSHIVYAIIKKFPRTGESFTDIDLNRF